MTQPRRKRLELNEYDGVTVVGFVDKKILDEGNIQRIGEDLFALVEEGKKTKLLVDWGNVEYMSCALLGKLITLHKMVTQADGTLVFCCMDPSIFSTFEITKLNKLFTIVKTTLDGLDAFKPQPKPD